MPKSDWEQIAPATVSESLPSLVEKKETGAIHSFSRANRSFAHKKRVIPSKKPWANSQSCIIIALLGTFALFMWDSLGAGMRNRKSTLSQNYSESTLSQKYSESLHKNWAYQCWSWCNVTVYCAYFFLTVHIVHG